MSSTSPCSLIGRSSCPRATSWRRRGRERCGLTAPCTFSRELERRSSPTLAILMSGFISTPSTRVERAREQFDASKDLGDDAASEAESIERLSRSRREDLLHPRLPRRDPADRRRLRTLSRQRKRRTVSRVPRESSFRGSGPSCSAGQLADGVRAGRHRGIPVGRCTPRGRSGNAARARSIRGPECGTRPSRLPPRPRRFPTSRCRLATPSSCAAWSRRRQEDWIESAGLYNVRADRRRGGLSADSSELRGEWLLLYGANVPVSVWERVGGWFVQTRDDLIAHGYPAPGGAAYLCCPVTRVLAPPSWIGGLWTSGRCDPQKLSRPAVRSRLAGRACWLPVGPRRRTRGVDGNARGASWQRPVRQRRREDSEAVLHIHPAQRADGLVEALRTLLAESVPDPFAPEVVAVPTRGMERWLAQRMSDRLGAGDGRGDGVCANVDFPSPRRLVGDAVATASGIEADADPWLPERAVLGSARSGGWVSRGAVAGKLGGASG